MLCSLPFKSVVMVDYDGINCKQYTPCLAYIQTDGVCESDNPKNVLDWTDEQLTPDQVLESPKFKELQDYMIRGIKHPSCQSCWNAEDKGEFSYRLNLFPFEEDTKELIVEINCSSICNIACRMCAPFASTRLLKDLRYFEENNLDIHSVTDNFFSNKPIDSLNSIQWKWIKNNSHKIGGLCLAGGEPLANKEVIDTLQMFADIGTAKTINLSLRTNALLIDKHFDLLNNFRGLYLNISVDGVGKIYDYIRYPGKWTKFNDNIKRLQESCDVKDFRFLTVVNALNVFDLNNIIDWNPGILKFNEVYPFKRGIGVRSMSSSLLNLIQAKDENAQNIVDTAKKYPSNKNKLKREIEMFDKSRNQSMSDYLEPALVEWLNESD